MCSTRSTTASRRSSTDRRRARGETCPTTGHVPSGRRGRSAFTWQPLPWPVLDRGAARSEGFGIVARREARPGVVRPAGLDPEAEDTGDRVARLAPVARRVFGDPERDPARLVHVETT